MDGEPVCLTPNMFGWSRRGSMGGKTRKHKKPTTEQRGGGDFLSLLHGGSIHYTLHSVNWSKINCSILSVSYTWLQYNGSNPMYTISLHNPWLLIELRNPQTLTMWNPDSLFVCLPPQLNCAIDWKIWCMVSYPIKVWRDLLHLKTNYISYKRV